MARILLFLVASMLMATLSHAETRAAFVVGNSAYLNAPALSNPARDARLVADTLSQLDFVVTRHENLTRDGFADALGNFLRDNRDADVTFFYFAGHGMQYDGRNYLVGTDAELRSELDIDSETIELDKVVELLERNSKAALVFVDACRDNPLATDFYRRNFSETRALETRGLARVRSRSDGSMLVFAAAPGQVAFDGEGLNSPFASALARHLPTEGAEILSLTKRIIGDVRDATDGRQSPIVTNDLTQEIFLREAALRPEDGAPKNDATFLAEQRVFDAVKFLRTPRAWARYFDLYPNGALRREALQLEALAFREELTERAIDRIQNPRVSTAADQLPAEAVKRLGLSNTDIIAIQAVLKSQGYDPGALDGAFGGRSVGALASFQRRHGLTADGVPDRATLAALGLKTQSGKEIDRFSIANQVRRWHDVARLETIGEDPRLVALLREIKSQGLTYGFYGGSLYVAFTLGYGRSWNDVQASAQRAGGSLATITSQAENDFVVELIRYDEGFWNAYKKEWVSGPTIGLVQRDGAPEPAGGWEWSTGEDSRYVNWARDMPNNNENRAKYAAYGHHHPVHPRSLGTRDFDAWDDYVYPTGSFVIEIP